MSDPSRTGDVSDRPAHPGTPRWVYVAGIIAVVLLVVFAVIHLAGGGMGGHTSPIRHG